MDYYTGSELESIKRELSSVISELVSISEGVTADFYGIGNEKCADCINRVADQYRYVKRQLGKIDTSVLTDEYKEAHGIE